MLKEAEDYTNLGMDSGTSTTVYKRARDELLREAMFWYSSEGREKLNKCCGQGVVTIGNTEVTVIIITLW